MFLLDLFPGNKAGALVPFIVPPEGVVVGPLQVSFALVTYGLTISAIKWVQVPASPVGPSRVRF
jgi:hypothetical protein